MLQQQQKLRYSYEKQRSSLFPSSHNPSVDTMEFELGVAAFFTKSDINVYHHPYQNPNKREKKNPTKQTPKKPNWSQVTMGSSSFCPKTDNNFMFIQNYSSADLIILNIRIYGNTPKYEQNRTKKVKTQTMEKRADEVTDLKRIKPGSVLYSLNQRMLGEKKSFSHKKKNAKYFMAPLHCGIFLD